MNIKYHKVKV